MNCLFKVIVYFVLEFLSKYIRKVKFFLFSPRCHQRNSEMNDTAKNGTSYSDLFLFTTKTLTAQRAEAILNKISHIIRKINIGLISVLQGFQKCVA